MSIVGTQWTVEKLQTRPDYNGSFVTVVETLDEATDRIRVRFDSSDKCIRVHPHNLVSRRDDKVDASVVAAAFSSLKASTTDDSHMQAFISRYENSDFDGALSAAATWSLTQLKQIDPQ